MNLWCFLCQPDHGGVVVNLFLLAHNQPCKLKVSRCGIVDILFLLLVERKVDIGAEEVHEFCWDNQSSARNKITALNTVLFLLINL